VFQLTVRKNVKDSRMPPAAAIRAHKPSMGAESHREFTEGDQQAHQGRRMRRQFQQPSDGAVSAEQQHLVRRRGGVVRIEVARVSQFLQAGEGEGHAEERPQGQQGPTPAASAADAAAGESRRVDRVPHGRMVAPKLADGTADREAPQV
jgi:hypothetical protein